MLLVRVVLRGQIFQVVIKRGFGETDRELFFDDKTTRSLIPIGTYGKRPRRTRSVAPSRTVIDTRGALLASRRTYSFLQISVSSKTNTPHRNNPYRNKAVYGWNTTRQARSATERTPSYALLLYLLETHTNTHTHTVGFTIKKYKLAGSEHTYVHNIICKC